MTRQVASWGLVVVWGLLLAFVLAGAMGLYEPEFRPAVDEVRSSQR